LHYKTLFIELHEGYEYLYGDSPKLHHSTGPQKYHCNGRDHYNNDDQDEDDQKL
jgi:hypothetical protein